MAQCTPCNEITDPTEAPLGTVVCTNNSIPRRLCDLEYAMAAVVRSYTGGVSGSVKVKNEAELRAALLTAGETLIELTANIKISSDLTIPSNKTIIFGDWMFSNCSGNSIINFYGECVAYRQQIFCNFIGGQIRGTFGRESVYPEWWGLTPRTGDNSEYPANLASMRDDIAINAALQSYERAGDNSLIRGNVVSLALGSYYAARPINVHGTGSALRGAGGLKTRLVTTINWKPLRRDVDGNGILGAEVSDLLAADYWAAVDGGNHTAVIWIGGPSSPQNTFRGEVSGMQIDCTYASQTNWGVNVSGISSRGGVEEMTHIRDVAIGFASGFGIGFTAHAGQGNPTVNGLTCENFEVTGPCKRTTVAIRTGPQCYQAYFRKFTVNMSLRKTLTASFALPSFPTGSFPAFAGIDGGVVADGRYAGQSHDYPDFGIVAQGVCTFEDFHMEGVVNGVYVEGYSGTGSVRISGMDPYYFMDRSRRAVWTGDGMSGSDLTTTPYVPYAAGGAAGSPAYGNSLVPSNLIPSGPDDWKGFSCAVLIDKNGLGNSRDGVVLENIRCTTGVLFAVRDRAFGIHLRSYGMGNTSGVDNFGSLTFYARGSVFARTRDNRYTPGSTVPYAAIGAGDGSYVVGTQDPASDIIPASTNPIYTVQNNSRQFFVGPIY